VLNLVLEGPLEAPSSMTLSPLLLRRPHSIGHTATASYINGWLGRLKKDKREIFRAAADAQRIVGVVLGFHPHFAAQVERPSAHHTAMASELVL
jgi:antirestriction protein ArdC